MKRLSLHLELTDELGIKSVVIDDNETGLPSDSKLINLVCFALLKSLHLNSQDLELQDMLNELNILMPKK